MLTWWCCDLRSIVSNEHAQTQPAALVAVEWVIRDPVNPDCLATLPNYSIASYGIHSADGSRWSTTAEILWPYYFLFGAQPRLPLSESSSMVTA